ncbi:MAG: hypothetical protein ABL907_11910 [Hyphomicrobium sp.]
MFNRHVLFRAACVQLVVLAVSACVPLERASIADRRPMARCAEAVADGLAAGRGHATALAMAGVRHQYDDARGYLLANGYRRVRVVQQEARCGPHPLGIGLVKCTAYARLCGR